MMTVRRAFLLLVAPLFLLLAGVNGALLFLWERAEAARQLDNQALAAAVTVAAFASGADDLAATLRDPRRDAAFREAAARVEGLDGLYIAAAGGASEQIAGRRHGQGPGDYSAPARPTALPIRADASGRRLATALAPMGQGRFVIAQIDAGKLDAQVATLRAIVAGLLVAAGVLGFGLAWVIAGRIARELAANNAMIAAIRDDRVVPPVGALAIRETRDLANAVRLMKTSVDSRLARGDRELALSDRRRDEAGAAAAFHGTALPPLAAETAGVSVAVRMLGRIAPGSFYALCEAGGRAGLVLGTCEGASPTDALALGLAARAFLERHLLAGDPTARVEQARQAFSVVRLAWTEWSAARPPQVLTLALLAEGLGERAEAYARRGAGLSSEAVADDLATLLDADGVLAVLKPSGVVLSPSGQGGHG